MAIHFKTPLPKAKTNLRKAQNAMLKYAKELRASGLSNAAIAKKTGLCAATIKKYLGETPDKVRKAVQKETGRKMAATVKAKKEADRKHKAAIDFMALNADMKISKALARMDDKLNKDGGDEYKN